MDGFDGLGRVTQVWRRDVTGRTFGSITAWLVTTLTATMGLASTYVGPWGSYSWIHSLKIK